MPIAPGLVDMLVTLKPEDATEEDFVFSTTGTSPISYWNFRDRGFVPALQRAGLADKGITIHGCAPQRSPSTRRAGSRCWRRPRSWGRRTRA